MAQCYPFTAPYSGWLGSEIATWSGYFIYAYRLDTEGFGPVYGELVTGDTNTQNIDPAWNVSITSSDPTLKGIPLGGPPPFISGDV